MSLFWDYFKNTLRFPLIWKPGTIAQLAKGGAQALDIAKDDITWLRKQFMPSECDLEHLQNHAEARGLKKFRLEDDEFWRNRVANAFMFYKMGGTLKGLNYFFEAMSIEAEIVEPLEARQRWEDAGGKKLDGSWGLDGSVKLLDFYNVTRMPYLQWAEFAVILNIATLIKEEQVSLLKWIVDEVKPARSVMLLKFIIEFALTIKLQPEHFFTLTKQICQPYPWDVNKLDGTWKLGKDDSHLKLDGGWQLDGARKLGEIIKGYTYKTLRYGVVSAVFGIRKCIDVSEKWQYLQLAEPMLKLDGGWKLGKNRIVVLSDTRLRKNFHVDAAPLPGMRHTVKYDIAYPGNPEKVSALNKLQKWKRLDGSWKLGQPYRKLQLDGTWKLGRKGITIAQETKIIKKITMAVRHQKLSGYNKLGLLDALRLDGTWKLKAHNKLDGTWKLNGWRKLSATRLKYKTLKLDGTWKLGIKRELKLDGSWKLDQSTGPAADMNIIIRKAA